MVEITETEMPYLTASLPGIGGRIKTCPEDFIVEEIPLYEFSGKGSHLFLLVEKRNLTTMEVITALARGLRLSRQQIGYAGLKDSRAVTRQWLSIEHIQPEQLQGLDIPQVRILKTVFHFNKLRVAHLAGNRFQIKIRNLSVPADEALRRARAVMEQIYKHGCPNSFGPQRFGHRRNGHLLGEAIIHDDREGFIDLLLGRPEEGESAEVFRARTLYEQGKYEDAYYAWPGTFHDQKRLLRSLCSGKSRQKAYTYLDKHLKRFFVSAFQSYLFNSVLVARMPHIDTLVTGDIAYIHDKGACFLVEDAEREQPRCRRFEISPTGPLFGYRMKSPAGSIAELEAECLLRCGSRREDFRPLGSKLAKGGRRPLRFQPRHIDLDRCKDDKGEYIELHFELKPGCYATSLLREVMKTDDIPILNEKNLSHKG